MQIKEKTFFFARKHKQAGLSLLEVPIAMFIIAVIFFLYNTAANSIVLNRNAKNQELAVRIGVSELEDLRATDFDSLPVTGSATHSLLGQLPSSSMELVVTDISTESKTVTITVRWQEGSSAQRSVKFSTYINRHGI